jgi:hypothetical protein
MDKKIILLATLILFSISFGYCQDRIIKGKVLFQGLDPYPGVLITSNDSTILDTTDFNGNFSFEKTNYISSIKFQSVMAQEENIKIIDSCDVYNIILLNEWTYDYISMRRAKRKLARERKKLLPNLYVKAYEDKKFDSSNCNYQEYKSFKRG